MVRRRMATPPSKVVLRAPIRPARLPKFRPVGDAVNRAASASAAEVRTGAPFALGLEEDDPLRDNGQNPSRMAELVRDRLGPNRHHAVNVLGSKLEHHKKANSLPADSVSTSYRDPLKVKRAPGADTWVHRAGTTKAGVSEQRPSNVEGEEHHAAGMDARQAVLAIDGPVGEPSATDNDELDKSKPSSPDANQVRTAIVLLSLICSRRFHQVEILSSIYLQAWYDNRCDGDPCWRRLSRRLMPAVTVLWHWMS